MSQVARRSCTEAFVDDVIKKMKSEMLTTITNEINTSISTLRENIIDQLV